MATIIHPEILSRVENPELFQAVTGGEGNRGNFPGYSEACWHGGRGYWQVNFSK